MIFVFLFLAYFTLCDVSMSMETPQKTKNRPTIRPRNLTPGHIPRENDNSKRYMYPSVLCSTIYNSQNVKAT